MSSNIHIKRICQHCAKEFIARTTVTQYCSNDCSRRAYKARLKHDKIKASNEETIAIKSLPLVAIREKEYLTVADVALLLTSSKVAVYDMINSGRLKAKNLSKRKTRILKADVDKLFDVVAPANPAKVEKKEIKINIADCYTIGQAEKISGMSNKALFDFLKRNQVKKISRGKFVYVPKAIIDQLIA
jgi:excisionase family DNA binding protein